MAFHDAKLVMFERCPGSFGLVRQTTGRVQIGEAGAAGLVFAKVALSAASLLFCHRNNTVIIVLDNGGGGPGTAATTATADEGLVVAFVLAELVAHVELLLLLLLAIMRLTIDNSLVHSKEVALDEGSIADRALEAIHMVEEAFGLHD